MDPIGTLIGVSEVSLALAGFTAIVLALGTRANALDAEILSYVRMIVSNAVGSALACLFAVAILALEPSPSLVWVVLSSMALVGTVGGSALNWLLFLRQLERRASGEALFWWSFVGVSCVLHLVNALGLVGPPSFDLFFLGLVVLLSQAALQFIFLVYRLLARSAA
jgi:hypothetical protein